MGRATHLLTQSIVYVPVTGRTRTGDPTFGAQVTLNARIEFGTQLIRDDQGTEIDCEAVIITETQIPRDARVWLVGTDTVGDTEDARAVEAQKSAQTPGGYSLFETFL